MGSIIAGAVVFGLIALAAWKVIMDKRRGKSACSSCDSCSAKCGSYKRNGEK